MYPLAPPETTVDAGEQEGGGLLEVTRLTFTKYHLLLLLLKAEYCSVQPNLLV